MLKFNHITKTFKSEFLSQPFVALENVNFEIPRHSMVGFLGANGAGKTTSLKIIMDFIRADRGSVEFAKELGSSREEIFKRIGFLPERPYFYPNLTGEEFLEFMGTLSEVGHSEIHSRVKKWAPRFKIDHALSRPLRTYSKGMLQRIGFMATILHEPEFIILDEPLSGLDPIGRKELKDVIIEVHKEGKTVFFSSHIVPDIEEICDRVVFLKEGKLVYDGEVERLLRSEGNTSYVIKFKNSKTSLPRHYLEKIQNLPGGLSMIAVEDAQKNEILNHLVSDGSDIQGIEFVKPSLEEIFYNIRSSNDR